MEQTDVSGTEPLFHSVETMPDTGAYMLPTRG